MAHTRPRKEQEPAAIVQPASVRLVEVTFSQVHTHRGVDFAKGDTLPVTTEERDLLRHFDVIEAF
jgi:hypothetical protein